MKIPSWLRPALEEDKLPDGVTYRRFLANQDGVRLLLKMRFKLGHADRNFPMLAELICQY